MVQPEARGETGATMEGMVGEKKFYPNVVSGFVQDNLSEPRSVDTPAYKGSLSGSVANYRKQGS